MELRKGDVASKRCALIELKLNVDLVTLLNASTLDVLKPRKEEISPTLCSTKSSSTHFKLTETNHMQSSEYVTSSFTCSSIRSQRIYIYLDYVGLARSSLLTLEEPCANCVTQRPLHAPDNSNGYEA